MPQPKNFDEFYKALESHLKADIITKIKKAINDDDWQWEDFIDLGWEESNDFTEEFEDFDILPAISKVFSSSGDSDDIKTESNDVYNGLSIETILKQWYKTKQNSSASKTKDLKKFIDKVCKNLWHKEDTSLHKTIELSYDLGSVVTYDSLLLNLADDYSRHFINAQINGKNAFNISHWTKNRLEKIIKNDNQLAIQLQHSVASFFSRNISFLDLNRIQTQIDMDINKLADILIGILMFIQNIKGDDDIPMPIQFDFWIYPKRVSLKPKPETSSDSDDDGDDEDEDDEKEISTERPIKEIGEFLDSLKQNINWVRCEGRQLPTRHIKETLQKLQNKMNMKDEDLKNKRFCTVIDMNVPELAEDTINSQKEIVTMYIPKKNHEFDKQAIPETLVKNCEYLYCAEENEPIGMNNYTDLNGYMFGLSFHVFSKNKIKAYLLCHGYILRFFLKDMQKIVPYLLTKKNNKLQELNDVMTEKLNTYKQVLQDNAFDAFLT